MKINVLFIYDMFISEDRNKGRNYKNGCFRSYYLQVLMYR